MIPLRLQPEPSSFDAVVRIPGKRFLKMATRPINWDGKDYWQRTLSDLYEAYGGICSYSAEWIPYTTGVATVDHFIPKSARPVMAYEWNNFRLACLKLNSRKGTSREVLDPFLLQPGWFILDFPSHLVKPDPALATNPRRKIQKTIDRLKLNDDDNCVKARLRWTLAYCDGIPFDFLRRNAPFIAYELERQRLIERIKAIMRI